MVLIEKKETKLKGCFKLSPTIHNDIRGSFIKTFHEDIFQKYELPLVYKEEYYSISHKGVLRGLHFQVPPADQEKIVYCPFGEVIDVVVDLRKNSHTYGQYEIFRLTPENGNMLYIPKGMAHGFYVLSDLAVMMYKATSKYLAAYDSGILWNSVKIPWPDINPIMSNRDRSFLKFSEFTSPF